MSIVLDAEQLDTEARLNRVIRRCAESRIYFAEYVLGVTLEDWQRELFQALDDGETRISIRSGNGVGKTFACAVIALHFLLFRVECKVICTSPSSSQLKDGLFPETAKWRAKLPDFLKAQVGIQNDRLTRADNPENSFMSFRTARKETPEALAGVHSRFVLCIVDEASAVAEEVYEAAQGTLSTSGSIFILIGNPTRLSGYFYHTHNKLRAHWWTRKVTSFDTSRVDQSFVDTMELTYGRDSNQYRVRVLGEFPTSEEDTLIPRDILERAVSRFEQHTLEIKHREIVWGYDPSRGNNDLNCLVKRTVNAVTGCRTWLDRNAMASAGRIYDEWENTELKMRPSAIYVDSIGIGGPVADRLRELGLPAIDVNVADLAPVKQVFMRLRDSLWYATKYWFETEQVIIAIQSDIEREAMVYELSAPLALFTSSGKNAVEPKPATIARIKHSPDRADALVITFMEETALALGRVTDSNSNWNKELDYSPNYIH